MGALNEGASRTGRGRWWNLGAPLLVAAAAVVLACFGIADSDFFWHLEHGERMLDARSLVAVDDWSHTAAGTPYAYYSWLAEILMALGFRLGGLEGLVLLKALLCGAVLLLLSASLGARGVTGARRAVLLLIALLLLRFRFYARPEIFTLLLVPGVDLLCLRWLDDRRRGAAAALPLLFAAWANLHPFVIVGLGLVGAHGLGGAIEARLRGESSEGRGRRSVQLLGLTAACGAATFLNPWGLRIYAPVLKLWDDGAIGAWPTREWGPPDWAHFVPFHLSVGAAALLVLVTIRRARIADLILLAAGTGLSYLSLRNVGLFPLMAFPAVGRSLGVLLPSLRARLPERARPGRWAAVAGALAFGAATAGLVLRLLSPAASVLHLDESRHYRFGLGLSRDSAPVAATAFLREHGLVGKLWNSWAAGGWIVRCCWPDMRVSLDGRQLPFEPHLARTLEVGVAKRLDELDLTTALVLIDDRVSIDGLRRSGRFQPVWFDDLATVWLRDDLLAQRPEIEPFRVLRPDEQGLGWLQALGPAGLAAAEREADRAVRLAPDSSRAAMLRGLVLRRLGRGDEALPDLRRATELDPTQATHFVNLGIALLDDGRTADARDALKRAVALDPGSAVARYDLALALVDLGHARAARRQLLRSLRLEPAQPRARLLLAGLELERGDLAAARREAGRVIEEAGGDAALKGAAEGLLEKAGAER